MGGECSSKRKVSLLRKVGEYIDEGKTGVNRRNGDTDCEGSRYTCSPGQAGQTVAESEGHVVWRSYYRGRSRNAADFQVDHSDDLVCVVISAVSRE